jgi:hypothetical protein
VPIVDCSMSQGGGASASPSIAQNTADPINPNGGAAFYVLRPDLSGIASGSTINSAELRLFAENTFNADTLAVYEMLRAWVSAEATWNNWSTGNAWATAGATGSGDRSASTIATYTTATSEDGVTITISIPAAVVQGWLDGTNNGLGLYGPSLFAEYSGVPDATNPPVLRVDYTEAAGDVLLGQVLM